MNTRRTAAAFFLLSIFCFICACKPSGTTAIRIVYESPMGCDEVSGTVFLKATIKGDGAPSPAAMRYRLWTDDNETVFTATGYPPDFRASFDSTMFRDGFVHYRAVPLDDNGTIINIKAAPYNAPGTIPAYKGLMVRNGQLDMTRSAVFMGAPLEPDTGLLDAAGLEEQLMGHLTFGASLMTHLRSFGFIPKSCFADQTTVVIDPAALSVASGDVPQNPVDLLARPVAGPVSWNQGAGCSTSAFFETPAPNGIPDIWEFMALDNMLLYQTLGPVDSRPQVLSFFSQVTGGLDGVAGDWFSMFDFERPVPYEEPEDILQQKIESQIQNGATSVLIYDFYNKATEFEMSSGSWPRFQEALDKANAKLGTSVRLGAISTNDFQLLSYRDFYRSLFLGVARLVSSCAVPADKKLGVIIAAHGSSTTNLLYDVSNIVNNQARNSRITAYLAPRRPLIHPSSPPCLIRYSEYANAAEDGLAGVGEQVRDWVRQGYDYIFVFPMEWNWSSRDCWLELRANAAELLDDQAVKQQILTRDSRGRTTVTVGSTVLVIGETIFEQKAQDPAAYDALAAASRRLLEDRLRNLRR